MTTPSTRAEEIMATVRENRAEIEDSVKTKVNEIADLAVEQAMAYVMDEFVLMLADRIKEMVDERVLAIIAGNIDAKAKFWATQYAQVRNSLVEHCGDEIAKARIAELETLLRMDRRS